jgi:putative DNA primase/helicase
MGDEKLTKVLDSIQNISEEEYSEGHKEWEEKEKEKKLKDTTAQFLGAKRDRRETWASEILVEHIFKNNYLYSTRNDTKSELWIYEEGIYVPNGRCFIKEILRKITGSHYSNILYNQVIAKVEADCQIGEEEFFSNSDKYPDLIPVKNGILNIFTAELKEFTPKKIFFSKLPISYEVGKISPKIENFLEEIFKEKDDKLLFYEMLGFSLLKEYKYEKAFMLVGDGRNGKGKLLEIMKRFLGVTNCCSIPLSSLNSDSFRISELHNKLANIGGDIGDKDLKDTSMFKSLTGRDLIGGKRKFLTDIHFQNFATMFFACNDLPMVYDTKKGFWDRWVLLEFPYTFVSEQEYANSDDQTFLKIRNPDIIKEILTDEELSGLLNEALLGLARLQKNKEFSYSLSSNTVKDKWIRGANSFIAFCMDKIEDNYDKYISKKELRANYRKYCKEHKVKGVSDIMIKNILSEMFGTVEDRKVILGYQERVWEGITWKK